MNNEYIRSNIYTHADEKNKSGFQQKPCQLFRKMAENILNVSTKLPRNALVVISASLAYRLEKIKIFEAEFFLNFYSCSVPNSFAPSVYF